MGKVNGGNFRGGNIRHVSFPLWVRATRAVMEAAAIRDAHVTSHLDWNPGRTHEAFHKSRPNQREARSVSEAVCALTKTRCLDQYLIALWRSGSHHLATAAEQLEELTSLLCEVGLSIGLRCSDPQLIAFSPANEDLRTRQIAALLAADVQETIDPPRFPTLLSDLRIAIAVELVLAGGRGFRMSLTGDIANVFNGYGFDLRPWAGRVQLSGYEPYPFNVEETIDVIVAETKKRCIVRRVERLLYKASAQEIQRLKHAIDDLERYRTNRPA